MSYVKLDEESTSISSQEVQLPGFKPVTLRLDVAVQHTLHWTAVTRDRSLSAQFEHSIGVTADGYEIFTRSPKGYDKPPY